MPTPNSSAAVWTRGLLLQLHSCCCRAICPEPYLHSRHPPSFLCRSAWLGPLSQLQLPAPAAVQHTQAPEAAEPLHSSTGCVTQSSDATLLTAEPRHSSRHGVRPLKRSFGPSIVSLHMVSLLNTCSDMSGGVSCRRFCAAKLCTPGPHCQPANQLPACTWR